MVYMWGLTIMLRAMAADCTEQFLSPLRLLQVALAKAKPHCFSSLLIHFISQSALVTAKYFD